MTALLDLLSGAATLEIVSPVALAMAVVRVGLMVALSLELLVLLRIWIEGR